MHHQFNNLVARALCATLIAASAVAAAPPRSKPHTRSAPAKRDAAIVINGTLEASLGQPRVHVQISDGHRVLTAPPALPELDDAHQKSFFAFLDTGAGGHVISKATAERFGIRAQEDAVFNEVGLHGATQVGVSIPHDIALCGASGSLMENSPSRFDFTQKKVSLQLSRESPAGLMALVGDLNVIGMPAIRKLVVEIDPSAMHDHDADLGIAALGAGPAVRLHESLPKNARVDLDIPLEYIDFNQRKHPANRGPLPTLAPNPVITAIRSTHDSKSFTGDWLLDTGAAASIISVKHAQALGLYGADGKPARPADFTLPLGGITGDAQPVDGFIIDRIAIKSRAGKTLEFRKVHVVVRDVSATPDNGKPITLDGVFAMNLLLPSASGLAQGEIAASFPGGFDRIYIDGKRGTLLLQLRPHNDPLRQ